MRATLQFCLAACLILASAGRSVGQEACGTDDTTCMARLIDALRAHAVERAPRGTPLYGAILREGWAALSSSSFATLDVNSLRGDVQPEDASQLAQGGYEDLLTEKLTEFRDAPPAPGSAPRTRVVGGQRIGLCDHPDTVAIVHKSRRQNGNFCSGVLVGPKLVLTAAHCICDLGLDSGRLGDYMAVAFDRIDGQTVGTQVAGRVPDQEAVANLADAKYFASFDCSRSHQPPGWGRDIALITLDEALVPPIPAQSCKAPPPAYARFAPTSLYLNPAIRKARVVGFGMTDVPRAGSLQMIKGEKFMADTPITSKICGDDISTATFGCLMGREMVMADPQGRRDTCGGDSGGPVYIRSPQGQYYVIAITSRAIRGSSCGPGGVYSLITPAVIDWMNSHGADIKMD